ncbi:lysozyme [Piscinibacter defluvii]|uniref:lysozyme n=1 Tax=Piscinibacter defluvii TaxID=1796922 RepID=UPI000FDD56F4|nr:lysozyme [Piscinibacter defluvii]
MRPLPDPRLPWPIALAGVYEIANSEGLRLRAYRCWAGRWSCGWGETDGVGPTTQWTKEYADGRLCDSLADLAERVRALCTDAPTDDELAAMVSLAYNIGPTAFARSTVLRQHNAGNRQAAARAFGLWNKARNPRTGQLEELPGLTARRAREAALYLKPDDDADVPMPQVVDGESPIARSPINAGGAAAVGAGALTAATQAADQLQQVSGVFSTVKAAVQQFAEFVGVPPGMLLAAALMAVGVMVMQQRRRQRAEGWA